MVLNTVGPKEILQTKEKFKGFNPSDPKQLAFGRMKTDPSLFALFWFKDERTGGPFTVFPYQDHILNNTGNRVNVCISRQSGKTTMACILALHHAFFNDDVTVVVVSKTLNQSKEVIKRMRNLLNTSRFTTWKDIFDKRNPSSSEIVVKNSNKKTTSRIISVPATDAARGYTSHLTICDEAAFWENGDYVFNQVVEPMTNFTGGKILLLSTPNGKRGFFFHRFNSKYWSSYQLDWRACPVNTLEKMEMKKSEITALEFAAEYEAKFVSSMNAYFNQKDISRAVDEDAGCGTPPPGVPIAVGVDFGKINDFSVIYIGYIENSDRPSNEHVIKVIRRIVKPLGTNYADVVRELQEIHKIYKPRIVVLDATGVGEGPSDLLIKLGLPVEAFKFSRQSKVDIMGNLKLFLEQRRIKIPDELELVNQLELFEYEYTNAGNMILHHPEGGRDDEVDAISLMLHGLSRMMSPPVTVCMI